MNDSRYFFHLIYAGAFGFILCGIPSLVSIWAIAMSCKQCNKQHIDSNVDALNHKPVSSIGEKNTTYNFNCYIDNVTNTDQHSGEPTAGKTTFDCGNSTYLVVYYDEALSEVALGGTLPRTKTLFELGCKHSSNRILCKEERTFDAEGAKLLSYREMILSEKKAEDLYFSQTEIKQKKTARSKAIKNTLDHDEIDL